MKNLIHISLPCLCLLTLLAGLGGCRKKQCHDPKNPECENYDPCYGKKPVTADFIFGGLAPINYPDYTICPDTIFMSGGEDRRGLDYR